MDSCFLCDARETVPLWKWDSERFLAIAGYEDAEVSFVLCGQCGLARQHPFLADRVIEKLYTAINLEAKSTDYQERYDWFCRAVGNALAPGSVLDIGCSEGKQLQSYTAHGWQAVGIETHPDAACLAGEKGIEIWNCAIEQAPLQEKQFDLILFFHLLEHLKSPRAFFQKLIPALREDGYLYFEVPNLLRPWGTLQYFFPSFHTYIFSPCHIEKLVQEFGLEIVHAEAGVNQRWLVRNRKVPGSPPRFESTACNTVIQNVQTHGMVIHIDNEILALENPEKHIPTELPLSIQSMEITYIKNLIGFIHEWHSQWKPIAQQNPTQGLFRLITVLYENLVLFLLIQRCGFHDLEEARLLFWGRIIQDRTFYRDYLQRLDEEFQPAILRNASVSMEKLKERLQTILRRKNTGNG